VRGADRCPINLAGRSAAWFEARRASFVELGRRAGELPEVLCEAVWPTTNEARAPMAFRGPALLTAS
jgi:hypothetical protein